MAESMLASKAMQSYSDSLSFSDEELEEYYASLEGSSDLFDFASYFVAAEALPVEDSETEGQTAPTDQTRLEARMTAEAIEMAYKDGYDIEDPVERLDAAIEAEYDAGSATVRSGVSGGSLGVLSDWLRDGARQAGDVGVVEASDGSGYTVAVFLSREDNHYPTVSVRHILIKAAASEDGTYSDKAKQVALDRINEIKAEFEATDKSEESFAALAEKYSEDAGSNTNGGLYEDIYRGQMVQEFNDFCHHRDHGLRRHRLEARGADRAVRRLYRVEQHQRLRIARVELVAVEAVLLRKSLELPHVVLARRGVSEIPTHKRRTTP